MLTDKEIKKFNKMLVRWSLGCIGEQDEHLITFRGADDTYVCACFYREYAMVYKYRIVVGRVEELAGFRIYREGGACHTWRVNIPIPQWVHSW